MTESCSPNKKSPEAVSLWDYIKQNRESFDKLADWQRHAGESILNRPVERPEWRSIQAKAADDPGAKSNPL
jgi:hypothetical protein